MKLEIYIAYDKNDIPRYVGIGKIGRHLHVNSGKSHNTFLNVCREVAGNFKINVELIEHEDDNICWKLARIKEIELIKEFGRYQKNNGTLFNKSNGGEEPEWCSDRLWYSSPDETKSKRFKCIEEVPKDWKPGRLNVKNKVKRIQNIQTKEIKAIGIDEEIPNSWEKYSQFGPKVRKDYFQN